MDSDDEPLNLLVPETKNPTIEKTFEEGSSKAEKDVKGKSNEKDKGKEKGKGKGKKKSENKIKKKKKETKPGVTEFDWGKKHALYAKEQCSFKANIIHQFPEHHISFDVFSAVANLDGLVKLLVDESNLTNKKWEHFEESAT